MWDRSKIFLRRAGTVILGINIVLWGLATYPRNASTQTKFDSERIQLLKPAFPQVQSPSDAAEKVKQLRAATDRANKPEFDALVSQLDDLDKQEAGENLRHSFAGRMGRFIEPVIAPLGFDWKMGIGIVASFAAREVFVSTMSTVYSVGSYDKSDIGIKNLAETLRQQKHADGSPVYTTLVAVTLMVFYVFALQCVSTVAIVRRETNSWKWPLFQWVYMGLLAWGLAFITYQGGRILGFG
jgi:ferrous iron transport protein B